MDKAGGDLLVFDSIVLNKYVGGFNAYAVEGSAVQARERLVVWFPTVHATCFLDTSEYDIPPEWIAEDMRGKLPIRRAKDVEGLTVLDGSGALRKDVKNVLEAIRANDAVLATGHLSWRESVALVSYAMDVLGIERVVITHPIYGRISMPIDVQKDIAKKGAYIEHCFSMYSIDGIPMREMAAQIRAVGSARCVLSSDVGQVFSKSPSEALLECSKLLSKEGLQKNDLENMLVKNPEILLLK
jgi:hypothetical protein